MFSSTGVTDHLCDIDSNLLSDAELNYGYSYNLMVDEDYKTWADAICDAFQLQYPPSNHEDALFLFFVLTDDSVA